MLDVLSLNLEIDEYDVIASHGASIGAIDDEELYYLMSRGLTEDKAKELLIMGFIDRFREELPMEYAVELNQLLKQNL